MNPSETDVLIVGAGPAGVSAAYGLRNEPLKVRLIDPDALPPQRVESVPPNGMLLAENIGLSHALKRACLGRASSMRLHWRERAELRDFGSSGPMLLDRQILHRALRDSLPAGSILKGRVRSMEQRDGRVEVDFGAGIISARFVIDARGRSALRAMDAARTSQIALGFTGRNPISTENPAMMLASLDEGWVWCCLLEGHQVSGALFLSASDLSGLNAAERHDLLAQRLSVSPLGALDHLEAGQVAPAMLQAADDPFANPLTLRIGDAALARDPISAHGLTHALRSGVQAAAIAATLLDPQGETDAAVSFARERLSEAVIAARKDTASSHDASGASVELPRVGKWPALSQPLALGPLRREAVLDGNRVRWSEAILLPNNNRSAAWVGFMDAAQLARLLAEPAPILELSRRLEQSVDPTSARAILKQLLDGGALQAASTVQAKSA